MPERVICAHCGNQQTVSVLTYTWRCSRCARVMYRGDREQRSSNSAYDPPPIEDHRIYSNPLPSETPSHESSHSSDGGSSGGSDGGGGSSE